MKRIVLILVCIITSLYANEPTQKELETLQKNLTAIEWEKEQESAFWYLFSMVGTCGTAGTASLALSHKEQKNFFALVNTTGSALLLFCTIYFFKKATSIDRFYDKLKIITIKRFHKKFAKATPTSFEIIQ